jgi:UDP-N-acetylglucosamine--N-acetylmuramyl-(pentapeptide) pyrophosphoryl-undecaprenol N-acetylglucosamine transferase
MVKILLTGGGTAGHIIPLVSIVREMRLLYPSEELKFYYMGPRDPFGASILSQEEIHVSTVPAGKIRRYVNFQSLVQNFFDICLKTPLGIFYAFWKIFFLAPDIVLSKGGYGSFPVVVAAWMLQVPIFLHESDVSPGLANRLTGKLATEIFVSFPKTEYFAIQKSIIVGNPIRREILEGSAEEGKKLFRITGERPVLLFLGGSQGAQRINDVVLAALPDLLAEFEILHQTGEHHYNAVKAEAEVMIPRGLEKYYHPIAFLREQELRHAYQICDLIIARAGSGTIFEIAAVGKPSILVPLAESAQNHQYKNAYAYAAHGAAIVLEEANLYPHFLLERIRYLLSHPDELNQMVKAAQTFAMPRAGQTIAEYLLGYLMQ